MRKPLRTIIRKKSGSFLCPVCTNIIIWTCSLGDSGYAYCSKSLYATQTIKERKNGIETKSKHHCSWTGKVKRKNEKITITYRD